MLKGSTPAGKRRLTWRTPRVRHPGLRTRAPTLQSFNGCHQKASHLIQQSSNTRNTHRPGGLSTAGAQLPQVTRRRAHSELSMEIKVAHLTTTWLILHSEVIARPPKLAKGSPDKLELGIHIQSPGFKQHEPRLSLLEHLPLSLVETP